MSESPNTPTSAPTSKESPRRWLWSACCDATERDKRNQRNFGFAMFSWIGSWGLVIFGIRDGWLAGPVAIGTGIAVNGLLGLVTLWVFRRYLVQADELRRKVELEALSLAFGIGLVGSFGYRLLEKAAWVDQPDIMDIIFVMMMTYSLASIVGHRRYR